MRPTRAGMRHPRRKSFQHFDCFLHSHPHAHNASVLPHSILDLADELFDSRVHRSVVRRGFSFFSFSFVRVLRFVPHSFSCARSVYQSLQQRVAGKSIRSMNAGRSCFPCSVKAGQASLAFQTGAHATHGEVRSGTNRNHVFGNVDVVLHAGCVNARETLLHTCGIQVREVEVDKRILGAANFHFMDNRPRHNVTRRHLRQRMVFSHEAVHLNVPQITALAAQPFCQQKTRRFLHVQRGGAKLNEFHVTHFRTRAEGHRHPVSRGSFGIGRITIKLPNSSGGQQYRRTGYLFRQTLLADQ